MEGYKVNNLLEIRDVIKTEDSRINYLRGLIRIAESDNKKTSAEAEFIYKIADIIGASYSEIWHAERQTENEINTGIHFETKQEKMLFLIQALHECWLDDDFSEAEHEEIIKIGNELEIDQTEVEAVEAWVKQGIEWMRAGAELIGLE